MKMWKTFLLIVTILLLLECDPIQAWRRRRRRRRSSCDTTACAWSWSSCSKTCGNGIRSATITRRQGSCGACDRPEPETCNVQFCPDIIECSSDERKECDENGKCLNIVGSYQCQCSDGYTGDGKTCSDINECDAGSHNCHSWATCKNTPGSFTCMCPEGFSGDGRDCENINECKGNTSKCDANAHCIDKTGTHECVCMKGYEGNGINCTDLNDCSMQQGKCADINTGAVVSGFFYQNTLASILLIIGGFMVFTILVISVYRCSIKKTSYQDYAIQGGNERQEENDASTNVNEVPEENIYDEVQGTAATNAEDNFNDNLYAHIGGVDSIRGEVVSEVTYDEVQAGNSTTNNEIAVQNQSEEDHPTYATTSKAVGKETQAPNPTNLEAEENLYEETQSLNITTLEVEENLYEETQAINTTTFKAVAQENLYEITPAPNSQNFQEFAEENPYENSIVSNDR